MHNVQNVVFIFLSYVCYGAECAECRFQACFSLVLWCRMCRMLTLSMFFNNTMEQSVDFKHIFHKCYGAECAAYWFLSTFSLLLCCRMCRMLTSSIFFIWAMVQNVDSKHFFIIAMVQNVKNADTIKNMVQNVDFKYIFH